jgi:hypothetical protein
MFCWALRNSLVGRWILAGLLCLVLVGGAAAPTRFSLGDGEATLIGIRAQELPLAALATKAAVRFEKQAHAIRLTLHKPERSTSLSWAVKRHGISPRPPVSYTFFALPRRFLPSRHTVPRGPNDPGEPFLASSSLS